MGREPAAGEVVAELGMTREVYDQAARGDSAFSPVSLDQPHVDGGTATIAETLPGVEDIDVETRLLLHPLLARLSDRDR